MALAAIDMALWTRWRVATQHRSCDCWALEKPIRAYGAVGYDGVEGSANVAESWAKRGFGGVKAKIGYPTVHEDVRSFAAMRQAVATTLPSWSTITSADASEAVERLRVLDDEGLTWVESRRLPRYADTR